jgi:hypothetical protein
MSSETNLSRIVELVSSLSEDSCPLIILSETDSSERPSGIVQNHVTACNAKNGNVYRFLYLRTFGKPKTFAPADEKVEAVLPEKNLVYFELKTTGRLSDANIEAQMYSLKLTERENVRRAFSDTYGAPLREEASLNYALAPNPSALLELV